MTFLSRVIFTFRDASSHALRTVRAAPAASLSTLESFPTVAGYTFSTKRHVQTSTAKQPLSQKVRFVDKIRLKVQGGKGGSGSVAFCVAGRGRHLQSDGGHGGRGGDVLLVATKRILSLAGIHQFCVGDNGGHGSSQSRNGASGQPRVIEVPVGTVVKVLDSAQSGAGLDLDQPDEGEELDSRGLPLWMSQPSKPTYGLLEGDDEGSDDEEAPQAPSSSAVEEGRALERARKLRRRSRQEAAAQVVATLTVEGQQLLVARGGKGGRGNTAFKSKPHGPPSDRSEEGLEGEAVRLLLEARLIADVGLVGLPNAGKSTLLKALTGARTQVGQYEFTTLRPQLGALMFDGGARLTIADIPGLLEGAACGAGRGNEFLRHIERTRCLLYVVDLSGGEGGLVRLTAARQLRVLQRELRMYHPALLKAPAVVVANKVDCLPGAEEAIQELQRSTPLPVVPVSAEQGVGLGLLRAALQQLAPPQLEA